MNAAILASELVKIILSGDDEYAGDYYDEWCRDITWSKGWKQQIGLACLQQGLDPARFGALIEEAAPRGEPIVYGGDDTTE